MNNKLFYTEKRFGRLKLHASVTWKNIWIGIILGVIVYYAGWGIAGLALLSHLEITWS